MAKFLKRILIALAILFSILVIAGVVMWKLRPAPGPARIELAGGASGVLMTYVYAWVIPTAHGLVLIDAGGDAKASELLAEVERRGKTADDVKAILLTHGHADHWPGSAAFPRAVVHVHPAEIPFMRGVNMPRHFLVKLMSAFRKAQALPRAISPLNGGEEIRVDGETFKAVRIPGHTEGSLMYLWNGILFTGDSLQVDKEGALALPPAIFSDDLNVLGDELRKALPTIPFRQLATSHTGLVVDGQKALSNFIARGAAR